MVQSYKISAKRQHPDINYPSRNVFLEDFLLAPLRQTTARAARQGAVSSILTQPLSLNESFLLLIHGFVIPDVLPVVLPLHVEAAAATAHGDLAGLQQLVADRHAGRVCLRANIMLLHKIQKNSKL